MTTALVPSQQSTSSTLPRILPLEEAAQELMLSVQDLESLVQSGQIPAFRDPEGRTMIPVPPNPIQNTPVVAAKPDQDDIDQDTERGPEASNGGATASKRLTLEEINARLAAVRREDFAHWENHPITLRDASKQFKVPVGTIDRWTRRGYVRVIRRGTSKSKPTLVNAADVAYCARIREIRQQAGIPFGAPLLDDNGNPYLLKRPLSLVKS